MMPTYELSPTDVAVLREAVRLGMLTEQTAAKINVGTSVLHHLVEHGLLVEIDSNNRWTATAKGRAAIGA